MCTCGSLSNTIKNEFETDHGTASETDYTLGFTEKLSGISASIFTFTPSSDQNFKWMSSSTTDDINDLTQSATVAVMCPSANYTGPTAMVVYWYTLFGSFLFVPAVYTPANVKKIAQGHVTNALGVAVAHQPVQLAINGKTYHTYTDNSGNYAIYSALTPANGASGQLTVGNVTQTILLSASLRLDSPSDGRLRMAASGAFALNPRALESRGAPLPVAPRRERRPSTNGVDGSASCLSPRVSDRASQTAFGPSNAAPLAAVTARGSSVPQGWVPLYMSPLPPPADSPRPTIAWPP